MPDTEKLSEWLAAIEERVMFYAGKNGYPAGDLKDLLELCKAQHEALARYPQRQQMAPFVQRARRLWEGK